MNPLDSWNRWCAGGSLPFLPWCIVKETAWLQHSSSQQRAHSCGRSQHWVIDWSACLLQQTPTSSPRCCLTKAGFVNTTCLKPTRERSICVIGRSLTELGICFIVRLTGKAATEALIWGSIILNLFFFPTFGSKSQQSGWANFQLPLPNTLGVTASSEGLHF